MADKKRQASASTSTPTSTIATTTGPTTTTSSDVVCGCPTPGPETIQVEQVLGANMAQRVVEFDMTVPTQKPDIEQVIDVYVKDVEIVTVDVIPNKVIVRGTLDVKVMYVAALPNQPVHAFEQGNVRWTRDIEIDGATPDMTATADVTVEYVNYDFDEDDPRLVHITIVLKVWARVITTTEMDVYALSPVDQVGSVVETPTASGSASDGASASYESAGNTVTASSSGVTTAATPGGITSAYNQFAGYGVGNVLVTGPGVTPMAGTPASMAGTATVTGSSVNVRTGPGTNFPVVTKVTQGTTVTLKDQAFGWYKVVLPDGNTTGWIAGWLLNTGAGTAPLAPKG